MQQVKAAAHTVWRGPGPPPAGPGASGGGPAAGGAGAEGGDESYGDEELSFIEPVYATRTAIHALPRREIPQKTMPAHMASLRGARGRPPPAAAASAGQQRQLPSSLLCTCHTQPLQAKALVEDMLMLDFNPRLVSRSEQLRCIVRDAVVGEPPTPARCPPTLTCPAWCSVYLSAAEHEHLPQLLVRARGGGADAQGGALVGPRERRWAPPGAAVLASKPPCALTTLLHFTSLCRPWHLTWRTQPRLFF